MIHSTNHRLLLALLMAVTAATAFAYDFEVDGIYYNKLSDGTSVEVTSGDKKYTGSVTIPSQVTYSGTTYSVTSIGEDAFYNCLRLTSVTIPNSVTEIGWYAFEYCSGLTSVTIPNSVTEIGKYAFDSCTGLTSVTIGNSVTSIGDQAFYGCESLEKVYITDLVAWCNIYFADTYSHPMRYAKQLYLDEIEVTDLVIPETVTSIGSYAFYGCTGLTSVTIPESVTSISTCAFSGCTGLT